MAGMMTGDLGLRRLALAIAVSAVSLAATPACRAEVIRPSDDAQVLAVVAAKNNGASSALRTARTALAADPRNMQLAVAFARAAIEEGRAQANPRRYGEAQAALAPWWSDARPPADVRVLRAVILQAFHNFPAALGDLDGILADDPRNAQARLTRAFVRLVTGDVMGATADCQSLPAAAGRHAAITCLARVAALRGAAPKAYDKLGRRLASDAGLTGAMRRFAIAIEADLAIGLAREADAGRLFGEAVNDTQPEVPLLAAYADYLLDSGRASAVLDVLDGKGEADILLLRRTIAAKRLGDPRFEAWSAILGERFAAAAASGVRVHLREEARYLLEVKEDAAAALPLAIANWAVQKEVADARILLACAIAAGKPEASAAVVDFIHRVGLRDARLTPLVTQLNTLGVKS